MQLHISLSVRGMGRFGYTQIEFNVTMRAEIGVMGPLANECQQPQEAR